MLFFGILSAKVCIFQFQEKEIKVNKISNYFVKPSSSGCSSVCNAKTHFLAEKSHCEIAADKEPLTEHISIVPAKTPNKESVASKKKTPDYEEDLTSPDTSLVLTLIKNSRLTRKIKDSL